MSQIKVPDFGALLKPFVERIPESARPLFLAGLERGAADRYRQWADEVTTAATGLRACADREEEIADRVGKLFQADPDEHSRLSSVLRDAGKAYFEVFRGRSMTEQFAVQAGAERQGAAAWRLLASAEQEPQRVQELEACARLEEETASYLEELLRDSSPELE